MKIQEPKFTKCVWCGQKLNPHVEDRLAKQYCNTCQSEFMAGRMPRCYSSYTPREAED